MMKKNGTTQKNTTETATPKNTVENSTVSKSTAETATPKKRAGKAAILTLCVFIALVLIGGYAFSAYVEDYYHALDYTKAALESSEAVTVSYLNGEEPKAAAAPFRSKLKAIANFSFKKEKNGIVFTPTEPLAPSAGIIFYPGGKVEYTAYAPLMYALAENGYLCVLLEMPYNLAVFDANAADKIAEQFPDIDVWYMSGHSLGGAMAASYLGKHTDAFDGLILLASYSTADLTGSNLSVISLYGSNDTVLNHEKYEKNKANLPSDYREFVIDGGCHAYFGCYGAQDGDGIPEITNEEQINTAVDYIIYALP